MGGKLPFTEFATATQSPVLLGAAASPSMHWTTGSLRIDEHTSIKSFLKFMCTLKAAGTFLNSDCFRNEGHPFTLSL